MAFPKVDDDVDIIHCLSLSLKLKEERGEEGEQKFITQARLQLSHSSSVM